MYFLFKKKRFSVSPVTPHNVILNFDNKKALFGKIVSHKSTHKQADTFTFFNFVLLYFNSYRAWLHLHTLYHAGVYILAERLCKFTCLKSKYNHYNDQAIYTAPLVVVHPHNEAFAHTHRALCTGFEKYLKVYN